MERNRRCQEADTKKQVTDSQSALLQSVLVLLITLQPPLRSPELGVRAEGFLVSINHIRTTPNPRARREIIIPNGNSPFRHHALKGQCEGRVQSDSLPHAGIEIRQALYLTQCGIRAGQIGGSQLVMEFSHAVRVLQQVKHHGCHDGANGIGARDDVGEGPIGYDSVRCVRCVMLTQVSSGLMHSYPGGSSGCLAAISMNFARKSGRSLKRSPFSICSCRFWMALATNWSIGREGTRLIA